MSRWWALSPLLLAGCATPAEKRAELDALVRGQEWAVASKQQEVAEAEEWNHHMFGIPSAGWVAISIVGILALLIAAICLGCAVYESRKKARELAQIRYSKDAEIRLAAVKRGNCAVCGAVPLALDTKSVGMSDEDLSKLGLQRKS